MLDLRVSKPYAPLYTGINPAIRYVLLEGGRSGGRSFEATQFALFLLVKSTYFRGAIMREVMETVKHSVWQDLIDRITEQDMNARLKITESPMEVQMGDKSIVAKAFKASSKNQTAKMKSLAGFNFVLIEEAEEINEEDFNNLDVSIRKSGVDILIILAFNPPIKTHWIVKRWFDLQPSEHEGYYHAQLKKEAEEDTLHIHATYKDNVKNLNPSTIRLLEAMATTNPEYYRHMVLGLVPSQKTGLIFKKWETITQAEFDALPYPSRYGLDFGYNDPNALVSVKVHDDALYIHEELYESFLDTDQLYNRIKHVQGAIRADSQAKQTIETLRAKGLWIEPSTKGQDSVKNGIKNLLGYKIHITASSKGILEEAQNYSWAKDRNKMPTDEPEDASNHAWDAVRYAIEGINQFNYQGLEFI